MKNKIKVGFIGCGNMASAIIDSLLCPAAKSAFKSNGDIVSIAVADSDEAKLLRYKSACSVSLSNADAVAASDYVFLCVKPQAAEKALDGLDFSGKVVISIMAGINLQKLSELTAAQKLVRVMPNLNARVGESYNAYVPLNLSDEETRAVKSLLGAFGLFCEVKEDDIDSVTGISGSGPAFVFAVLKAFYDEAVSRGFTPDAAKSMAVQTVLGSAVTALDADEDFDSLIQKVCSKGGTTIEGVNYLRENNFCDILRGAISKAIARATELSES